MRRQINFLYTNIGRGHPFYLDGIAAALIRRGGIGLVRNENDVFGISRGLSAMTWKLARWTYRAGSSPGALGGFYNRLRRGSDYNRGGLLQSVMARSLRRHYRDTSVPVLVAHPLLVALLAGRPGILYQHGELTVPREALVRRAEYVFVPTDSARRQFLDSGYAENQVIVTGLCIEPALVRQAAESCERRLARLVGTKPLVAAVYSSGAEPVDHVRALVAAAASLVAAGGKVIVLCRRGGRLASLAIRELAQSPGSTSILDHGSSFPAELTPVTIVPYSGRREETTLTARLFPHFDFFVAPAHERSNWACGLGLPMVIVGPDKGSFAPLNSKLLLDHGVAERLGDPAALADMIDDLRASGQLNSMAQAGWGQYAIDGFDRIAGFLTDYCGA